MGLLAELLRREGIRHGRELSMKYMLSSLYGKFGSRSVYYADTDSVVVDGPLEEHVFCSDLVVPKLYRFDLTPSAF